MSSYRINFIKTALKGLFSTKAPIGLKIQSPLKELFSEGFKDFRPPAFKGKIPRPYKTFLHEPLRKKYESLKDFRPRALKRKIPRPYKRFVHGL
jgi:hypothetical protein